MASQNLKPNKKVLFALLLGMLIVITSSVYFFSSQNESLEMNGVKSLAVVQSKKQILDRFSKPKFYGKLSYRVKSKKITALVNLNTYQYNTLNVNDTVTIIYDASNVDKARIIN